MALWPLFPRVCRSHLQAAAPIWDVCIPATLPCSSSEWGPVTHRSPVLPLVRAPHHLTQKGDGSVRGVNGNFGFWASCLSPALHTPGMVPATLAYDVSCDPISQVS